MVNQNAVEAGTHIFGSVMNSSDRNTGVIDTNCEVYVTLNLFVVNGSMRTDLSMGHTIVTV
jgi:choline dehydrogenase-like flavoprotein